MFADHLFFVFPPGYGDITIILLVAGFVIGTALGSFVQAAALRLNRDEDIIFAPSVCRSCRSPLTWYQNLPLLGWLLTWGQCRQCGASFSPLYLFVEIIMGSLVCLHFWVYSIPVAMAFTVATMLMMICALTDLERMLLHLPVMLGLGAGGLGLSFMPFWPVSVIGSILGLFAPALLLVMINLIYRMVRGEDGFGSGDVWLLAAVGAWLGPVSAIVLFFVSALLGALVGIIMIALKKGSGHTALPFGVFISLVFIFWPILNILVIV